MDTFKQPLTNALPARKGVHRITLEWLINNVSNNFEKSSIRWLDNEHIIYTIPPSNITSKTLIELVNINHGARMTLGKGLIPNPSPNGKWIAFIGEENNQKQLCVMKTDGTNVKLLTNFSGGLKGYPGYQYGFAWSNDSNFIALHYQDHNSVSKNDSEMNIANSQTSAISIEQLKAKFQLNKIDVINITTEEVKNIHSTDFSLRNLSWLPNDKILVFMVEINGLIFNENDYTWVQTINIINGQINVLAEFDGLQQLLHPTVSPDGNKIAVMYDADNPIFNFMPSIGIINIDQNLSIAISPLKQFTHELKLKLLVWSKDNSFIFAV